MEKSAKNYHKNPLAYAKKRAYDKMFNKKKEQIKKRVEANRKRREAKAKGQNVEGKEYDHRTKKFISQYTNRSAKEKSRVKGYKQK